MVERNNIYWEYCACLLSLPSRKCGLKFCGYARNLASALVTSFAEVWIEIKVNELSEQNSNKSLPSRKCGLKYDDFCCQTEEEGHFLRGSVD